MVIFCPHTHPLGVTTIVPSTVLAEWQPRAQQIYPGETLASLVMPHLCSEVLAGRDMLCFINNEASAAALIRASAAEPDVLALVQQAHLQFHQLQIRTWFEWVDTESNPADGLSRDGFRSLDGGTGLAPPGLQDFPFPSLPGPHDFLASLTEPIGGANSG